MKTRYVIAIFVVALFAVTLVISQMNPIVTGNAIGVQQPKLSFFQRIFGAKENPSVEVVDNAMDVGNLQEAEVSDNCRAVKVENPELSGNDICDNIDKECQWILAERTRTYYESNLNAPQINCEGMIQAETKEYSLSAIACSGLSTGVNSDYCSRMTTVASAEPKLGEMKVSEYKAFEVMCC